MEEEIIGDVIDDDGLFQRATNLRQVFYDYGEWVGLGTIDRMLAV